MVLFTDEAFGARLLEAITAGLYDGNLNCLREYTQNCIDSKANRIDVYFENRQTVLVIEDNGCGMERKKLKESLYLGKSDKPDKAIGWRGIGIWSGVPICRRIVIITKKQNNPKLRVEIDCNKLRSQYGLNVSAAEVLTDVTGDIEKLEKGSDESEDTHFTMVRLEEILPNQRTIFKEDKIREYLSRVVPVPFNTSKFTLGKKISKMLIDNGVETNEKDIFFEKQQIFRPPYSDDIFFSKTIEKKFVVKGETVAYGWVLSSKKNRKLNEPNRGIYFKKKGVTIGSSNLVLNQYAGNYNQWQYGEIHIIADELRENAPRNNFEANNDIIDPFYKQVGEFIHSLQLMNQYQSDKNVETSIEQIKKLVDVEDVKPAKQKINRTKKKFQRKRSFPKEPALQEVKESIDKKSTKNNIALKTLEKKVQKIEEETQDPVKIEKEKLLDFIKTAHPQLKKHLKKTTKTGKLEFNIDAMDPIKDLLKRKTGLKQNEIVKLSQLAYDWKTIPKGDCGPILTLANKQPNSKERYRGRYFGVMIQTLHDLFVNPSKHEEGKASFAYYESMSDLEKMKTLNEFNHTLNLVLRLIEKSKKIRNP